MSREEELIPGARYEDSYALLHRLALARARKLLRNDDDAEEIAQETMLRAYSTWSSVFLHAEAWVTRVATNLAISKLRRAERVELPFDEGRDGGADERLDVTRAIATLPPRQQQVMVLRHVADLGEDEVAELLGISTGAVKRHLHRAMTTLKEMPELASAYQRNYDMKQFERRARAWVMSNIVPAPAPPDGFPPPPWDVVTLVDDEGYRRYRAVDTTGELVIDANGEEVATGCSFRFALCKPLAAQGDRAQLVSVPLDIFDADARSVLDRALVIAERFGSSWVSSDYLGLALAERLDDLGPIQPEHLLRGVALRHDGPHADARLALLAEREKGGWRRAPREGMATLTLSTWLVSTVSSPSTPAPSPPTRWPTPTATSPPPPTPPA